jgi:hypothetical protein
MDFAEIVDDAILAHHAPRDDKDGGTIHSIPQVRILS